MKPFEISELFSLDAAPHSVRVPSVLMDEVKNDAKNEGRTLGKHLTAILAEYLNNKRTQSHPPYPPLAKGE